MEVFEEKIKSKKGGKREGAGRKRSNHGKYYGFNSTKEVELIIESLDVPKAKFINDAIMYYSKLLGMQIHSK